MSGTGSGGQNTWSELARSWGAIYSNPSNIPGGIPIVPGQSGLQQNWPAYGRAWKAYHDSLSSPSAASSAPVPPIVTSSESSTTTPQAPTPDASENEWTTYGRSIGAFYSVYGRYHSLQDRIIGQAYEASAPAWKEYGKAMSEYGKAIRPSEETNNSKGWADYGRSWGDYGKAAGNRYTRT